ncbi:MAG: outer membrane beta-barrel protein [Acidobacteriia bacterium]|nr:outer membrane beta-barrel protein [Terriglobia bacterium]
MNGRLYRWLAAGTLVLTLGGPLSGSAQVAGQGQVDQEDKSVGGQHVLLAAVSAVPTAAAKAPAAVAAPPAMASSFNWTGFYVGGHFGYGRGNGNMTVEPLPTAATFVNLGPTQLHTDPSGKIGGIQGGYNWQHGDVVLGAEADYSFADMNGAKVISPIIQNNNTPFPGPGNNITALQDTDWIGTVRARVGLVPVARLLVYGTGGLAYGHVTYFANTDFKPVGTENYPAFIDKTKNGWCVGTGAEVGLATHFTARFEYLYYDLGRETLTASPNPPLPPFGIRYSWATSAQLFRGGFNVKF